MTAHEFSFQHPPMHLTPDGTAMEPPASSSGASTSASTSALTSASTSASTSAANSQRGKRKAGGKRSESRRKPDKPVAK